MVKEEGNEVEITLKRQGVEARKDLQALSGTAYGTPNGQVV